MIPLADVVAGPVSSSSGVNLIVVLAIIIVIEAAVLRLMKWRGVGLCLLDSTLMNLASAVVGLLIAGARLGWLGLLVAFALSVVIEGAVLLLLKRHPARRTWLASLAANAASYAVLLAIVILLGVRL